MRNSFTQPQFLSKRRIYAICLYSHPYHLSLKPLFVERLASTSAAKQPLSKTPLINQPSSASNFKKPILSHADLEEAYTPKPLSRPLGQLQPPQPDENTGVDPRSWRERRDDFWDYDKHLARRQQLYVFHFILLICLQALSSRDRADSQTNTSFLITISILKDYHNRQTIFPRLDYSEIPLRKSIPFSSHTIPRFESTLLP